MIADPDPTDPATGETPDIRIASPSRARPVPPTPPAEPAGKTSSLPVEQQAARTPDPAPGARSDRVRAPGRERAPQAPVGGALAAADAPPIGSRAAIAAAMSEAELEEGIRSLCKDLGILRFHVRDSRGMNRGLPDDILIGTRGVLWRECKTQRGRITPEQRACGEALKALGQDFAVWRPSHLLSWQIAQELVNISGHPLAMAGRPYRGAS